MRSGSIMVLAVAAVVLTACTSGSSQQADSETASPSAPVPITTPSDNPTTSIPFTAESALKCGNFIDRHPPTASMQIVLGVVALPTAPAYPALQTALTGDAEPGRLFAKTGLIVKASTTFDIVVPAKYADRLGIGWGGAPSVPTSRLTVTDCPNPGGSGWLVYPGGYWIDHPACVPLIVKADGKEQQVHIGLGTACPGQLPPQGPNQT
jgi:hypothetical protein